MLIRKLATYIAEDVFGGWEKLPAIVSVREGQTATEIDNPLRNVPSNEVQNHQDIDENRFARLFELVEIAC